MSNIYSFVGYIILKETTEAVCYNN